MAQDLGESIRDEQKRQEAELDELTARLERLRVQYDRYFMGLERIPPLKDREALERDLRRSDLRRANRTEVKFRFNNLRQSMATQKRRWDRIMRLIEEGRFKRERNALSGRKAPPIPKAERAGDRGDRNGNGSGATGDDGTRAVFESWLQAQKKVGRSGRVDYDRFRAKLEAQKRAQMEKYGWKDVDYEVRVSGRKVALVARPVKGP